jgi:hypothetical protein
LGPFGDRSEVFGDRMVTPNPSGVRDRSIRLRTVEVLGDNEFSAGVRAFGTFELPFPWYIYQGKTPTWQVCPLGIYTKWTLNDVFQLSLGERSLARSKPWSQRFFAFLGDYSNRVFSRADLARILSKYGAELEVPKTLHVSRLIAVLTEEHEGFRKIEVRRQGRTGNVDTKVRFCIGEVSPYAIGVSLIEGAYLSHASAMFLHALTDQVPKTIYVNREQSPKPKPELALTQPAINRAFKRPPRTSSYVFASNEARYVCLSGKNSSRLEVAPIITDMREEVEATKLERTLIDIVVRPEYAGGPHEILQAYRSAVSRMSINTLLATLRKLDYVYPYHQCIGFLLERAGAPEHHLAKIERLGIKWDFYLAHQIADPDYASRWRLHYPQGL